MTPTRWRQLPGSCAPLAIAQCCARRGQQCLIDSVPASGALLSRPSLAAVGGGWGACTAAETGTQAAEQSWLGKRAKRLLHYRLT